MTDFTTFAQTTCQLICKALSRQEYVLWFSYTRFFCKDIFFYNLDLLYCFLMKLRVKEEKTRVS